MTVTAMKMQRTSVALWCAIGVAGLSLAQGQPRANNGASQSGIERNRNRWERTGTTQPVDLPDHVRQLNFITNGQVVIRGGVGTQVLVQVRQGVSGRLTEEQARAQFNRAGDFNRAVRVGPGVMTMNLSIPGSPLVSTDLEITVPHHLSVGVDNRAGGGAGSVQIDGLDGNATVTTFGGTLQFDHITGSVNATTRSGSILMGTIGGAVRCVSGGGRISLDYAGGQVNCETAGGDVQVKYVGGSLEVSTEGGNIRVDKAAAWVQAHSVAGLIQVGEARGTVTADTMGGSIEVGSANGVKAESAAGMVRVRGASGPMTISTMMGNILAELVRGGRLGNSAFTTGAGDITVMIPAEMGLSIRARDGSGMPARIFSPDFPELQVKSINLRSPSGGQGTINGGGPVIDLNASGGAIYLQKVR